MGKRVNLAELATEATEIPTTRSPSVATGSEQPYRSVPVQSLTCNPLNKRSVAEDDDLEEVAETIRARGVIQPLVVCSSQAYLTQYPNQAETIGETHWVVLIGNRRLAAARRAGLDEVPVLVNDEGAASMYEVMLIENGHRRDLPPALEAEAMAAVLSQAQISRRELSRRIGKTHVYISQRLALLGLIPPLRDALEEGTLTIELARQFGELTSEEQQQIADRGKPYHRDKTGNAVSSRASQSRSIRITSPAAAAESIRQRFTRTELAELVRLLSEDTPTLR
jgi:ParB family chromosome partitioning protein